MTPRRRLAFALLIGIAVGVGGATVIRAQQAAPAPGYFIAEVEVTDPATMQKYGAKVPDTLAPFNSRYVIRGGRPIALEGDPPKGIVVIAFDSVEQAKAWYDSPAYQAIKPLRLAAAKSRIFIAEGVAPK